MTKNCHTFPIRVYYEDTDAGRIVYYANYLKFAERARTEALRLSGFDQSELMRLEKIGFVVRRCVCDFLKPAMLDDLLTIETYLIDINKVSMRMNQTIRRGSEVLVTLEVKLAIVDINGKLSRLPDSVRKAMLKVFKK
jgi:acyl-CoA thioester hydrolase